MQNNEMNKSRNNKSKSSLPLRNDPARLAEANRVAFFEIPQQLERESGRKEKVEKLASRKFKVFSKQNLGDIGDAVIEPRRRKNKPRRPAGRPLRGKRKLSVSRLEYPELAELADGIGQPVTAVIRWYKSCYSSVRRQIYSRMLAENPSVEQNARPLAATIEDLFLMISRTVTDWALFHNDLSVATQQELIAKRRLEESILMAPIDDEDGVYPSVAGGDDSDSESVSSLESDDSNGLPTTPVSPVSTVSGKVAPFCLKEAPGYDEWFRSLSEDDEFLPVLLKSDKKVLGVAAHCSESVGKFMDRVRRIFPKMIFSHSLTDLTAGVSGFSVIDIVASGIGGGKKTIVTTKSGGKIGGGSNHKGNKHGDTSVHNTFDAHKHLISLQNREMGLQKCSLKLAAGLANPFNPACYGMCGIADSAPSPSLCVPARLNFTMTCGSAGFGFITVHPTICSDVDCVAFSNSASAFTDTAVVLTKATDTLADGVAVGRTSDLPLTVSQLINNSYGNPGHEGRVLAVGLRLRYIGVSDSSNGLITMYSSPHHDNVSIQPSTTTAMTIAKLRSFDTHVTYAPHELKGKVLTDFPVYQEEETFAQSETTQELTYPYSHKEVALAAGGGVTYDYATNGSTNLGAPTMVVAVDGNAGDKYDVEVIFHVEAFGNTLKYGAELHESDPVGADRIMLAAAKMKLNKTSRIKNQSNWNLMQQALVATGKQALKIAIPASEAALMALLT